MKREERLIIINNLRAYGFIDSQIAGILGVSRQRINQIVHASEQRARAKTHYYVKNKKLIRPTVCSECGNTGKIEAHHPDYSKPLEVDWLCKACHTLKGEFTRGKQGIRHGTHRGWVLGCRCRPCVKASNAFYKELGITH